VRYVNSFNKVVKYKIKISSQYLVEIFILIASLPFKTAASRVVSSSVLYSRSCNLSIAFLTAFKPELISSIKPRSLDYQLA
jgi:hypothetical protein